MLHTFANLLDEILKVCSNFVILSISWNSLSFQTGGIGQQLATHFSTKNDHYTYNVQPFLSCYFEQKLFCVLPHMVYFTSKAGFKVGGVQMRFNMYNLPTKENDAKEREQEIFLT